MQPTSQCCKAALPAIPVIFSDDPFSPMVVLDYYDGPASGFVECKACKAAFHFYLLDWDEMHVVRIFALAPIPPGAFQSLCELFNAIPDRNVWIPPVLAHASEEALADMYSHGIQNVIDEAAKPTTVIAWSVSAERTLAIRAINPGASLLPWFDRQPDPVAFDWFGYLRVARPLQPA
jgi:hypothetical protein